MRCSARLVVSLVAVCWIAAACEKTARSDAIRLTGGDPDRGVRAIQTYGCGGCHDIPGVGGASGLVGPPLGNIASRVYLAGQLPNSPDNMIRWIRFPQQVEPRTAMPDMRVSDRDARDIAAYLLTLR